MVVRVPLLRLPVDLSVAPTKGSFHLRHGEGAHRRAARRPFVPEVKQEILFYTQKDLPGNYSGRFQICFF